MPTTGRGDAFRAPAGVAVHLATRPTTVEPLYTSKHDYETLLDEHIQDLSALQSLLYASNPVAVLIIFQALDAAGKDGANKHVMSGVNPQGCRAATNCPSSENN